MQLPQRVQNVLIHPSGAVLGAVNQKFARNILFAAACVNALIDS
jgi:hypothetical protein